MPSTFHSILKNFKIVFRSVVMITIATLMLKDIWSRRSAPVPLIVSNDKVVRRTSSNDHMNRDVARSTGPDESSIH